MLAQVLAKNFGSFYRTVKANYIFYKEADILSCVLFLTHGQFQYFIMTIKCISIVCRSFSSI